MSKLRFQSFTDLPESFIADNLSISELNKLKAKYGNHPYLKAWVAIHEGDSEPYSLEHQKKVTVEWDSESIKNALFENGIKFYEAHNSDNSTQNRSEFGEFVKNIVTKVKGKLSNIVIGVFPENKKNIIEKKDVISIEFEADLDKMEKKESNGIMKYLGKQFEKISAIALGESGIDSPGFPGAVAISSLQAFENNKESVKQMPATREEILTGLDASLVRDWVNRNKDIYVEMIFPVDRFMPEFVPADDAKGVKSHFKNGEREIRRALNDYVNKISEKDSAIKTKEDLLSKAESNLSRFKIVPKVKEHLSKLNMPEQILKLVEERIEDIDLAKYKDKPQDCIDEYINKVVEGEISILSRWKPKEEVEQMKKSWFTPKEADQTESEDKNKPAFYPESKVEQKKNESYLPED